MASSASSVPSLLVLVVTEDVLVVPKKRSMVMLLVIFNQCNLKEVEINKEEIFKKAGGSETRASCPPMSFWLRPC